MGLCCCAGIGRSARGIGCCAPWTGRLISCCCGRTCLSAPASPRCAGRLIGWPSTPCCAGLAAPASCCLAPGRLAAPPAGFCPLGYALFLALWPAPLEEIEETSSAFLLRCLSLRLCSMRSTSEEVASLSLRRRRAAATRRRSASTAKMIMSVRILDAAALFVSACSRIVSNCARSSILMRRPSA